MIIGVLGRRCRRTLMTGVGVLAATLSVTGAAHAAVNHGARPDTSCTTSWASGTSGDWNTAANWTNGVPNSTCAASITVPGTYTVTVTGESVQAQSLTLGASSGTQTLEIDATDNCGGAANAELALASGGTATSSSIIELTQTGGCTNGTPYLEVSSGTLASAGKIETVKGTNESGSADLDGAFTNTGTISIGAPTAFGANLSSSSLDNKGTLSLGTGFTLSTSNAASVNDDTGGSITTGGGTGYLTMSGGTYTQGAGTTSPATLNPANPAVILNSTTLTYNGTGASSLDARGNFGLSGNIGGAQNLTVQATDFCSGATNAQANVSSSLTNAGTIQLTQTGGCTNGTPYLEVATPAVLTNSGTIRTDQGTNESASAQLDGAFVNTGTIAVNGPTLLGNNTSNGSLDNKGALTLAAAVTTNNGFSVTDDTLGSITNSGGTMSMNGGTYTQGAGTTSPATLNPANPAVILNSTALTYSGSGASSIIGRGNFALAGNLGSAQNLTVQATDFCSGATNAQANVSSSLTNAGTIQLTQTGGCTEGTPYLEVKSPAVLTNSGTIRTDQGTNESASAQLDGAFVNTGTIAINAASLLGNNTSNSSLDNKGTLSLATGQTLTTNNSAAVTDDTAGSISNGAGTGDLVMNGGTYSQGAGSISQTDPSPTNPAVILNSTALKYTGKGKGTVVARGTFSETGNLAKGQDLVLEGTDFCSGATSADMIPAKKLTNAAVITFAHAGGCASDSVIITLGSGIKLTNTGTLSGTTSRPEEITGGTLTSTGTVSVNAGDTLEDSGTLSNVSAAGVLKGGIYTLAGTFQYANSTFDNTGITNNDATLTLTGSGAFTDGNNANALRNLATNAKKLTLSGGESLSTSKSLTNTGSISLGGGSTLNVAGGYTQSGTAGALTITLASATSYGQVVATGPSSLSGTLTIDQTYDASASTSESILGSSARTGTFTKVVVKNTGGKGSATPAASYTGTGVTVTG